MSGFFNSASGANGMFGINGQISGFFNRGVPVAEYGPVYAGIISGLFNSGTGVPGFFNIVSILKNVS